jgi:hypothetical protein
LVKLHNRFGYYVLDSAAERVLARYLAQTDGAQNHVLLAEF